MKKRLFESVDYHASAFVKHKAACLSFVILALTGCATPTRYVSTYCLSRAQLDQLKASQPGKVKSSLTGKADVDVGILAGSAIRLRAHDDGLLTVLGGCADPNAK